jgi:carbon monoxide dehydrogenase subunit G
VWDFLTDPERIAQCLPGCERLIKTRADAYDMTLKIGIGPIRGVFTGTIRLHDLHPIFDYQMSLTGSGAPGFVQGEGKVTLAGGDAGTQLQYSGEVTAGGAIATVGQRMIGGAARMVLDQFFKCAGGKLTNSGSQL